MKTSLLLEAYQWSRFERVIVLSPHLDDAVLSCGGLLLALRGIVPRLAVTVGCGNPIPRARLGLKGGRDGRGRRGFVSPAERRREDIAAMHLMDCDFVHLGFADCIYRRSPTSGELLYRSPRTRWSPANAEDAAHVEELVLVLGRLCQNMGRILLISPLTIGYHVDHSICAHAALRLATGRIELLFYEDFPYVVDKTIGAGFDDDPQQALQRLGVSSPGALAVPYAIADKAAVIAPYESQVPLLFGDEQTLLQRLSTRTYHSEPAEFFWPAGPRS